MLRADFWIGLVLLGLALGFALASGCGRDGEAAQATPVATPRFSAPEARPGEREVAVLRVRGQGEIGIELLTDRAPATVANFKKLAQSGFYDGTTFHRVLPGFVIQGGDPNTRDRDPRNDGRGNPGWFLRDEIGDAAHVRGVVSMANAGRPDSAGSQFFIVVADARHLDGRYTAFGLVVDGLDLVDRIAAVPTDLYGRHGPVNRPLEDVVVESVRIEPTAAHLAGG